MTNSRRYSTVSIDGDENVQSILEVSKFMKERSVFRTAPKHLTEDEYASFLLRNAIIYKQDGTTLGNLLNAELEGGYILRGQLVFEEESKHLLPHLKSANYDGEYIEVKVQIFSIQENPTTLWAAGERRWFEIDPSEPYEDMYRHMIDGMSIFFGVTEIYEQVGRGKHGKSRLAALTIDDILSKLSFNDGTGYTLEGISERIKSHGQFLLSQMRRTTNLQDSVFFRWLAAECEDIHNALRSKTGEEPVSLERIHFADPEIPEQLVTPPPEIHQPVYSPILPPKLKRGKGKSAIHRVEQSPDTISDSGTLKKKSRSVFATSSPPNMAALDAILWVIKACIDEGLKSPTTITFGVVVQWLNFNFSLRSELEPRLSDHLFCKAILTKFAGQLHSAIPPKYLNSPLARDLAAIKGTTSLSNKGADYDAKLSAEISTLLFNRRKTNGRRISQDENSPAPPKTRQKAPQTISSTESSPAPSFRTPHASKTIPATQSGRPSGKQSTLRIPNTTSKRAHDPMDIDLPSTKRHRAGSSPEVEMGPSSPSLSPTPSPTSSPSSPIPTTTTQTQLNLITTPLPTHPATGPLGSYTCAHPLCPFTLPSPTPSLIRAHELFHLSLLDKERLVEHEAGLGNFRAGNLIERLKALGHASQPVEESNGGKAKEVKLPVREAVHSRYAF